MTAVPGEAVEKAVARRAPGGRQGRKGRPGCMFIQTCLISHFHTNGLPRELDTVYAALNTVATNYLFFVGISRKFLLRRDRGWRKNRSNLNDRLASAARRRPEEFAPVRFSSRLMDLVVWGLLLALFAVNFFWVLLLGCLCCWDVWFERRFETQFVESVNNDF